MSRPEREELEVSLRRTLATRPAPAPDADPVTAVHRGMRRRQQRRVAVTGAAALATVGLLSGGAVAVSSHLRSHPAPVLAGKVGPSSAQVGRGAVPSSFRASDLSFVSADRGWAIGLTPCHAGACPVLLTTTDGARDWHRLPARGLDTGALGLDGTTVDDTGTATCATDDCSAHLSFATPDIGYAWSGAHLATTTDGGRTWTPTTSASALQGLAAGPTGVARVLTDGTGRSFLVQTSEPGSLAWTTRRSVPLRSGPWASVSLARHDDEVAVLLQKEHQQDATTTTDLRSELLVGSSTVPDPCGGRPSDHDQSVLVSIDYAEDGSLVGTCQRVLDLAAPHATSLVTSADDGRSWQAVATTDAVPGLYALVGARSATHLLVEDPRQPARLLLTDDDGRTSTPVATDSGATGDPGVALRFTSRDTAVWLSADRSQVWHSADSGATWTAARFNGS